MSKFIYAFCSSLLFLSISILVANANAADDWDIDNSGEVDALTDGLLMLRFSFGLRGEALTNDATSTDSTLTTTDIEAAIFSAQSIFDIDGDGSIDALTDGLLFLRYLFGLSDNALISDAVSSEATRSTVLDISQYIDSYMPSETNDSDSVDNADHTTNDSAVESATGSNWIPGEYYPSTNFANQCQNPRSNSNYQDLIGTYEDENNWIRSWSHENYLWLSLIHI